MGKPEIFVEGDHVVYPTHGVGKVERIATEEIAGHKLELIHITFEENRMTLRVPVAKARSAGLRKLATRKLFDEALTVLKGRARIKRTMWSRRAQEYEAKINSGDPLAIAEVVRDLHRNAGQPDQSFSERQIYEAAMDRLAAELAALDKTDKLDRGDQADELSEDCLNPPLPRSGGGLGWGCHGQARTWCSTGTERQSTSNSSPSTGGRAKCHIRPCRAAPRSHDLVGQIRVQIMHRVDLRRCRVAPGLAERTHALLHAPEHEHAPSRASHRDWSRRSALCVRGYGAGPSPASPLPAITKDPDAPAQGRAKQNA